MPTFPLWDRASHNVSATETITVDRSEVESTNDVDVRDSESKRRTITNLIKKDGSIHLVGVPAGEVQDRLNDDYAEVPDMNTMFGGLDEVPSEPPKKPRRTHKVKDSQEDDLEDDTTD